MSTENLKLIGAVSVSYTHLDVYKRQSRSVASAFTSEQQRHSATFFGEETQQNERAGDFYKKSRRKRYVACGDVVERLSLIHI